MQKVISHVSPFFTNKLHMLSREWPRGRCMSQRDVTRDSWREAVERRGWRWDSHNGESFSSEYRSELYSLGGSFENEKHPNYLQNWQPNSRLLRSFQTQYDFKFT